MNLRDLICYCSVAVSVLLGWSVAAQEKVIRLYPGAAPGSESWTHEEKESRTNLWNTRVVFNVVSPTLTVFQPDPAKSIGTAVIICPGGAFFALSIDSEGYEVARWLRSRGVTAFVLKYRLVKCETDDPTRESMTKGANLAEVVAPIVKLAMADGLAAVAFVRQHAVEYGVKPDRIGIIGFSAGGAVVASVAYNYTPESRPDFVAPIYSAYFLAVKGNVPADAPPMFILAATDDQFGLAPQSIAIYNDWTAARKSAELHLYSKGGHGFGMRQQNLPSDRWIERFADWLEVQGWLK